MKKYHILLLALIIAPLLSCSGYRLGNIPRSNMIGVKTIHVAVARNKTLEPYLPVMTTNAILRAIDNDGTYKSARSRLADATLEVTITDYNRRPIRRTSDNALVTEEYEVSITANVTLRNVKSGTIIFKDRKFKGSTSYFTKRNIQESERQANPLAAEKLAYHIVNAVAEGW